jgi:hypothetical protein
MQWDCAELAAQDATGLLPPDGVLYLFCDLTWGDPFDFQLIHAPGSVDGMQAIPIPPDLPPVYGDEGAYQVPYCSPQIAKENQDVPRLLPKWPFIPIAFSYPAPPRDRDIVDTAALIHVGLKCHGKGAKEPIYAVTSAHCAPPTQ